MSRERGLSGRQYSSFENLNLTGLFSVLSLLLSLSLPHWLVTVETLPPSHLSPLHLLELHIGLFSVCPQVNVTTVGVECTSISYGDLEEVRSGLWLPVSRTARILTRMR